MYFNQWNSYPFIYLKPEKGTPFWHRLPVWAIIGTLTPCYGEALSHSMDAVQYGVTIQIKPLWQNFCMVQLNLNSQPPLLNNHLSATSTFLSWETAHTLAIFIKHLYNNHLSTTVMATKKCVPNCQNNFSTIAIFFQWLTKQSRVVIKIWSAWHINVLSQQLFHCKYSIFLLVRKFFGTFLDYHVYII